MDLERIANNLIKDSLRNSDRGLSAIAQAEQIFKQSYEGRFLFELMQNVRDANKEIDIDGDVFIELNDGILSISNTGAEFSEEGIDSITTIGKSTKQSQEFIGFKGIGFKSVQEITEKPRVITNYGSVYFDRELTISRYNQLNLSKEDIPIFFFPHYVERDITDTTTRPGIVTTIELPLKESITQEYITKVFDDIRSSQLILLGNINKLSFKTESENIIYSIEKDDARKSLEVFRNQELVGRFKTYTPERRVMIPEEIINKLEGKEKQLFTKNSDVEIKIVMEEDEHNHFKKIPSANLYLFYPLDTKSGFRFLIHSYFIVTPERKGLRDSPLNEFLLKEIGRFISTDLLSRLKKLKANTNNILCYERIAGVKLDLLYDTLKSGLVNQRFIYDSITKKYYSPKEVIVADGFDKQLFPDGIFGDRQLVFVNNNDIEAWLREEFEIPYLTYESISSEIENECRRQLRARNLTYFQSLYNYVSEHDKLDISGKKVLLTSQWKLVSSNEDVFYGGGKRNLLSMPDSIKRHIHFIHKDIKISDFREGRSRTGITEFSTFEFARRLLKLFKNESVPNEDLLNSIFNLGNLDKNSEEEIRGKILLPIDGSDTWLSPLHHPIYFEKVELRVLYPEGNFIDEKKVKSFNTDENISKHDFLTKCGVWDIPALYIHSNAIYVHSPERRHKVIEGHYTHFVSPYYIFNDRLLDIPIEGYSHWFTNSIILNWERYRNFILDDNYQLRYKSSRSDLYTGNESFVLKISRFIEDLSYNAWIVLRGDHNSYTINEIVGIDLRDFSQAHNKVIGRYLKLLPINYYQANELIEACGLLHLNGESLDNYIRMLRLIKTQFEESIPQEKGFVDFFNRILSKLVDFYVTHGTPDLSVLEDEYFLGRNSLTGGLEWELAKNIYYIDDKQGYNFLPSEIKEKVQPHFTNRDKNTFGRIASRIGKRLSKSIQKELAEAIPVKSDMLVSYFRYLPESIAILESSVGTILNEIIESIKDIRIFEVNTLKVILAVDGSDFIQSGFSHFVDTDSNNDIYISKKSELSQNKLLAESVNEMYSSLLGKETGRHNLDLLLYLNSEDKSSFLDTYDILDNRITEISNILFSTDLSPRQRFWQAVILSKEIEFDREINYDEELTTSYITGLLQVERSVIENIDRNFDFVETSNQKNIPLLKRLLNDISITLEYLNKGLFPKIDFRDHFISELTKLKNGFENRFNNILYNHLLSKEVEEKEKYQDYLDEYKTELKFYLDEDHLNIDIRSTFIKTITKRFQFLQINSEILNEEDEIFDPVTKYSQYYLSLVAKLKDISYKVEQLELFLAENLKRSLVYFGEIEQLANEFKEWLSQKNEQIGSITNELELEAFLKQFEGQVKKGIEEVSTASVDLNGSVDHKQSGGKGRRYDGAAFDKSKQYVGLVSEMKVFEELSLIYEKVSWVSKYACKIYKTHPGYNPEGQDGLGYDIEYLDHSGIKYYVEVKGKMDDYNSFEFTKKELKVAYQMQDYYNIFFVTNVFDNNIRRIKNLGNLFSFDEGEDFFSNKRFTSLTKNYIIRFKE
ncbi:MAG: DUF3883 domain-containing protein [Bacteroidales bacterium]|nr:DUF3883 domain-containing protein [Bacteroidales bacterium]